jgi:AcrR family transcriptional regulator
MDQATISPSDHKVALTVGRGERRRQEIAAVAQRVFLERGFSDTTMQAIAEQAGASKETLYRHFGSKEELFAEIIRSRSAMIAGELDTDLRGSDKSCDVLSDLGMKILRALFSADAMALYRLVIAEVPRSPELGNIYYEQGCALILRKTTNYLKFASQRGDLVCPKPALAAKIFVGSVIADYVLIGMVKGVKKPLTEAKMREHVSEAVGIFLAKYGAATSARRKKA